MIMKLGLRFYVIFEMSLQKTSKVTFFGFSKKVKRILELWKMQRFTRDVLNENTPKVSDNLQEDLEKFIDIAYGTPDNIISA